MKIAIVGLMRSGKDTVGDYLVEKYDFKRFAFAQGIGTIIREFFPEEWAKGKPRALYQGIGQAFREHDPNVWIKYIDRDIRALLSSNPKADIVITDTRQLNEYKYLKENGFLIIKIIAHIETRIARMTKNGDTFNRKALNHDTEKQAEAMPFDYLIHNDGTLEELHEKLEYVIRNIRRGGRE